jgi:hypothetical protein
MEEGVAKRELGILDFEWGRRSEGRGFGKSKIQNQTSKIIPPGFRGFGVSGRK